VHDLPASLLPWPPGCIQRLLPCKRCRVGPCGTSPKPIQSVQSPLRDWHEPRLAYLQQPESRARTIQCPRRSMTLSTSFKCSASVFPCGAVVPRSPERGTAPAGVSRLVPHALLRLLQPEDRLALGVRPRARERRPGRVRSAGPSGFPRRTACQLSRIAVRRRRPRAGPAEAVGSRAVPGRSRNRAFFSVSNFIYFCSEAPLARASPKPLRLVPEHNWRQRSTIAEKAIRWS
jgi:hypothetical protein